MQSSFAAARETAGDAILILDAHGRVVYCTDAAAALFGRTPDEIHRVRASALIDGLPPAGTRATAELLLPDGRRLDTLVRVEAWEAGGARFCTVLLGDDGAESPAAPRRSEASYRELVRMFAESQRFAHVGSFTIDVETRQVHWSNELFRIYGVEPESPPELSLEDMIARAVPADRDRLASGLDAALRGEARLDLKFAISANGRDRVVRAAGQTSVVPGQVCLFGSVLDVTAEEEAIRELADAKRMTSLGRVAATMAHEFNNVLAGIGSFAEYLNRRGRDEDTRRAAEHIGKAIRRGKTVTDEILRYTRAKPPVLSVVDVHAWLEAFLPEANALTGGRTLLENGKEFFIRGDVAQLNQVLVNLLINARDASPPDAPIVLRVETAVRDGAPMLDLAVIDRGTGIPPEVRDRLFEPLFTTKRSGTGLGLPVVDQVVRAHGGVVRMRTEIGKGSEFHVLLPLHRGSAVAVRGTPAYVLIADDNEEFADRIRKLLERKGVHVRTVHRGSEAIAAIESEPPDVLVLDVGLPDVRGAEIYRSIVDRWPDLPIVFVSGQKAVELEPLLRQRHVAFLAKPFAIEELIAAFGLVTAA